MDEIFDALGSPTRRIILDRLYQNTGQSVHELAAHLKVSRQAANKQLGILLAARLVVQVGEGEEKRFFVDPVPLAKAGERWLGRFARKEYPLQYALEKAVRKAHRWRADY